MSTIETAFITYTGDLGTEAVHVRSGQRIRTDAPLDNKGKGEAFSPTDLLSTSLACCMMTTMGIIARDNGIPLSGFTARVVKHMASGPRRVARVEVHLELDGTGLDARQRDLLDHTAKTCPVALSLHPDVVQEMTLSFR